MFGRMICIHPSTKGLYRVIWVFLIWTGLFISGCQTGPNQVNLPTIAPTAVSNHTEIQPVLKAVTSTPAPTAPPSIPTTIPTATSMPSPTARPVINLYLSQDLPAAWEKSVETTINNLKTTSLTWDYQLTNDPGSADLTLQPGSDGLFIFNHPIALTIPFTTDWEGTTTGQAVEILQNGHPLATPSTWETIPVNYKSLRIDGLRPVDPGYPLQQPWSLIFDPVFEEPAVEFQKELMTNPPGKDYVQITAVGDIMLSRSLGGAIRAGNLDYPFEDVAHLLKPADITVGNLETSLGDIGQPALKSYAFQSPPGAAEALALAGFDIVSLANNHAMDYGPESLLQGLDLLRRQNVAPIGAGANRTEAHTPNIQVVNGIRIAFLGYVHVPIEGKTGFDVETWDATESSPGLAWAYPERITADVTAARQSADLVVVVLHSGYEYVEAPSQPQKEAAYAAIDAGATIVIGHHAHILQGIEFYNDGVIVYGLGNFAFEIDGDPSTAILNVWLDRNGVHQLEIIPAVIQFGGQPRPAEPYETGPILSQVYFLTNLLNAR